MHKETNSMGGILAPSEIKGNFAIDFSEVRISSHVSGLDSWETLDLIA